MVCSQLMLVRPATGRRKPPIRRILHRILRRIHLPQTLLQRTCRQPSPPRNPMPVVVVVVVAAAAAKCRSFWGAEGDVRLKQQALGVGGRVGRQG